MIRVWLCLGLLTVVATQGFADPKDYYYRKSQQRKHHAATSTSIQSGNFVQLLNPDDSSDTRVFNQRYWVDHEYASGADAPVFFYLCGEAACDASYLSGAVAEHAKAHGAHLVALEHRYYGQSQYFDQLTTDNLKYLSTANALKDAARFEQWATSNLGLSGKWIVVGGSYPGSLSAYYRMKYPNLVIGSLASSAPVQARANFEQYDHHVWEVAGSDCAPAIQKVTAEVEAALTNPTQLANYKTMFQAQVLTNNDDFLYLVADIGAAAVQYGYRDQFCQAINSTSDPIQGYATFANTIYQAFQMTALNDSVQGAVSTATSDYESGIGMRQWYYQSCTEYGYWQVAYHDPSQSARSQRINLAYHQQLCERLFNISTPVDESKINDNFYKPLLDSTKTSEILFTNGSEDPWSELGITDANGNNTNPSTYTYLIQGGAHCDDLEATTSNDSASLVGARQKFDDLITGWLN